MALENYVDECSMQRPPLLEPNGFCLWIAHFETYVKSKDINLWQVNQNDDFYYEVEDSQTKLMKETPYELLEDDQKKKLGKNNKAKMTLYNSLPRKEYERVFMCKTVKEQESCLKVSSCSIIEMESQGDGHEEAKDLATLLLDELIGNLKVYEMVLDNDVVASKTTKEKVKSLALEAKLTREQTSDDSDSQGDNDENVYEKEEAEACNLMARNFRKFFRKGNRFGHDNRFGNGTNRFGRGRGNNFGNKGGESSKQKGACYNCIIECHFASECRKMKENKLLSEEHEAIAKKKTNIKTTQHVSWQSNLKSIVLDDMLNLQKLFQDKEGLRFFKNDKTTSVCLKCDLLPDDWIVDSGCTKHMTGNRRLFTSYKGYDGGHVVFGSNLKGKVVSGGGIGESIGGFRVQHTAQLDVTVVPELLTTNKPFKKRNLPKLSFERYLYDTCGLESQGNASNRSSNEVSTSRVLELLHLNLFGPSPIQSYEENFYTLVIVDDHSNYTWVVFLESKEDVLNKFKILCKRLENLHDCSIVLIVTNHSSEFDKLKFGSFCEQHGTSYNLSGPFTSQSSEIVERPHRKLRKMSRAIKAYIVLNKEIMRIEESLKVTFDDILLKPKSSPSIEDNRINEPVVQDLNGSPLLQVNVLDEGYPKCLKESSDHLIEQVTGELNEKTLRSPKSVLNDKAFEDLSNDSDFDVDLYLNDEKDNGDNVAVPQTPVRK
uniref:Retrovirus-related Pol polyprotein from transposon TNT 1-94 n=1 Tax=Tanacetum cinerariifolium TaxID=118510 RepID=A0A699H9A6_TANCI|nr:retrovirus-related Pol polyprotein from transposon TNT 1-94 [Tanacetum cinerariifolium]